MIHVGPIRVQRGGGRLRARHRAPAARIDDDARAHNAAVAQGHRPCAAIALRLGSGHRLQQRDTARAGRVEQQRIEAPAIDLKARLIARIVAHIAQHTIPLHDRAARAQEARRLNALAYAERLQQRQHRWRQGLADMRPAALGALDQHDTMTELRQANRARRAGGPAANHGDISDFEEAGRHEKLGDLC